MVSWRWGGGRVVPMSDVNSNKYSCCLTLQVLDKNRERTNDRIYSIRHWLFGVTFTLQMCLGPFFSYCFIFSNLLSYGKGRKWGINMI